MKKNNTRALEAKTRRASAKAIVKATDDRPMTVKQLEALVGQIVHEVNRQVRVLGEGHETLCDWLVEQLFAGDAHAALAADARKTPLYRAVRRRAGLSMELNRTALHRHVQIGAIGRLRDDDLWRGLGFSKKVELLPLLKVDDNRELFNGGVRFAAGENVGLRHVREFVQKKVPRLPGSPGRPRAATLTLSSGSRLAETGIKLANARQRAQFAKTLQQAPEKQRRKLVRDLRKTKEYLGALLDLLGPDDG